MTDDTGRDPIAEQDEAARQFLERTGRRSTDPSPPAFLHVRTTPNAVFGRFPGGTDPRAAVGVVFAEMFPDGQVDADPYPDAIEATVIEDCLAHPPGEPVNLMKICTCVDPPMYSCEDCEEFIVPRKLKGIGYLCDDCHDKRIEDELVGW
jgi:hypothetical protein